MVSNNLYIFYGIFLFAALLLFIRFLCFCFFYHFSVAGSLETSVSFASWLFLGTVPFSDPQNVDTKR
jgi:hypothetical protein